MTDRQVFTEEDWAGPLARELRPFPLGAGGRVVVVAAHPDDETLGVSGCLRALHASAPIDLVIATDGENAFPDAPPELRVRLGRTRRRETEMSLRAQGLDRVRVHRLRLPGSGLASRLDELTGLLRPLLDGAEMCLAPWPDDPHPDHRAAGLAALRAAPITTHRWSYPIWMWHWTSPDDPRIPWHRAFRRPLDTAARQAKAAGIAAFASQTGPGPDGSPPILPPNVLSHFRRDHEIVFRHPPETTTPADRFVTVYSGSSDPWDTRTSWYERRKRAIALAALPRERYRRAVEPGCGSGELTACLAERCDDLLAFDPVPAAVVGTRAVTAGSPGVRVERASLPGALPAGPLDLVVAGEILYYLGEPDLTDTIDRVVAALEPGGDLLAVHCRHWPPEAPHDALEVHRRLTGRPEPRTLVEHRDEDFLLHVLRRR